MSCFSLTVIRVFQVGVVVEEGGVMYFSYSCEIWNEGGGKNHTK